MLFTQTYLHILWSTKKYKRLLVGDVKLKLGRYVLVKSSELDVPVKKVTILPEHVHLIIEQPATICLSDYMHELKGASSYWTNKNALTGNLFRWQKGFDAYSIGPSELPFVMQYLERQQEIHQRITFQIERNEWRKGRLP